MTAFKKYNHPDMIAYMEIDFSDVKIENYISLDLFFVYSSKSSRMSKYATTEEIELSKGLGKKMLCYGINLLIENNIIDRGSTMIKLNAGGGYCPLDDEINKILSIFSFKDMDDWIVKYINSQNTIQILKSSPEEKAITICNALDNLKLTKYYEEYGLTRDIVKPEELDLSWIPMTGYIYNVLKKCENVSNEDVANMLVRMKRKRLENYDEGEKKVREKGLEAKESITNLKVRKKKVKIKKNNALKVN